MNFKNNKGITLVALAITITVLIILAGITLGSIQEDNRSYNKNKKC